MPKSWRVISGVVLLLAVTACNGKASLERGAVTSIEDLLPPGSVAGVETLEDGTRVFIRNDGEVIIQGPNGEVVDPATRVTPTPAKLRALSNVEFRNAAADLLGVVLPLDLFKAWSPNNQFSGFDAIEWSNFDTKAVRDRLDTVDRIVDLALSSSRVMSCTPPGADVSYSVCGPAILERLGERAFRRPLKADEIAALKTIYDQAVADKVSYDTSLGRPKIPMDVLKEGVRATLGAILLSPQFMTKSELSDDGTFVGTRELNAYELASRLSFMFTSSIPDDTLWALAKSGEILKPDVLAAQVDALLGSKPDVFVENFMGQWFGVRDLKNAADATLEQSLWKESKEVLLQILKRDLPVNEILKPGFTFVNQQLATHYGMDATGMTSALKEVPTQSRGGVLMQGSVLTVTSTSEGTSPIRRGRYVQGRILCKTVPLPGPELFEQIAASQKAIPPTATVKERMSQHRNTNTVCYSCHKYMDPIGLGLESFDQHGQTRTYYNGDTAKPVETDSELLGTPFQTFDQLNNLLVDMPDVYRCAAQKLATYALGRVVEPEYTKDGYLITSMVNTGDENIPSFKHLVHRMVQSVAFRSVEHPRSAQ